MASKKLVEYHIARLKDKNPQIRLQAIQELKLLEAVSAIDVLQEVFDNDSDEEVRKAAQQAGRELFKRRLKTGDLTES